METMQIIQISLTLILSGGLFLWFKNKKVDTSEFVTQASLKGQIEKIKPAQEITYKIEGGMPSVGTFGAIANNSPADGAVNDSTEAIQKAVDSGYSLQNIPGCFYISETIVIRNPIEIRNVGGFPPGRQQHKHDWKFYGNRQTVFYTDKNIELFKIAAPRVHIYGGLFDTSTAKFHNKLAIGYDLSVPIWGAKLIDIGIYGNPDTLHEIGNGTIGILIDSKNAKNEFPIVAGHLHMAEFSGTMEAVGMGVMTNEKGDFKTSVNSLDINFNIRNAKQYYDISAGVSSVKGIMQEVHNVQKEEIKPGVQISGTGTELDVFIWDLSDEPKNGLYKKNIPIEVKGAGVSFGAKSMALLNRTKNAYAVVNRPLEIIPKNTWKDGNTPIISLLENDLILADKRGIKISFESSGTIIQDKENLLGLEGNPTSVTWDKSTGFAEVILSNVKEYPEMWLSLKYHRQRPQKIQFIKRGKEKEEIEEITTIPTNNERGDVTFRFKGKAPFEVESYAFKLIGSSTDEGYVQIADIGGLDLTYGHYPFLHTGGGQQKYGALEVEDLKVNGKKLEI